MDKKQFFDTTDKFKNLNFYFKAQASESTNNFENSHFTNLELKEYEEIEFLPQKILRSHGDFLVRKPLSYTEKYKNAQKNNVKIT